MGSFRRTVSRWGGAVWLQLPQESLIPLSFLGLILLGTLALRLPAATHTGRLGWVDALFTATSASCVTGLVVVDTGSYFTPLGQAVILLLIQLGGLGIITISSFFAILLGKRIPLRQREIVRFTHSSLDARLFLQLVRRIVLFTLSFEALGTVLLWLAWREDFGAWGALPKAVFHAVSAFCNAGFSLFPDSLISYRTNLLVNLVFMGLIVLGGIGFLVIYDVERRLRQGVRLSLHSRLALGSSLLLIALGTLMFWLLEHRNVLAGFSWPHQLLISLFQSVTPRTAGFNTVDFSQLTNSTLIFTCLLMFVGGSPGSTAGGIKTTTWAVFFIAAANRAAGRSSTNFRNRTIPEKNVNEALAVILISGAILLCALFTLQWTEAGAVPHHQSAGSFMETTFEAFSAFGTVGLSTGATAHLSQWGKLQIILLMLVGRVGPLSVAVLIARRQQRVVQYEYYKENVMVG